MHPEDDWLSTAASYLVDILGTAAIVGWGMFWRARRVSRTWPPSRTRSGATRYGSSKRR